MLLFFVWIAFEVHSTAVPAMLQGPVSNLPMFFHDCKTDKKKKFKNIHCGALSEEKHSESIENEHGM